MPLIDIMFFLLAAFMLVSLSMVNLKSVKVNLPTATSATSEARKDFVDISVDKSGAVFLDKKPMAGNESWPPRRPAEGHAEPAGLHQRGPGRPPRRHHPRARPRALGRNRKGRVRDPPSR